jgi:hypothetical protein
MKLNEGRSPQSSISPATEFEESEMLKDRMLDYSIFGDAPQNPLLKSSKQWSK